MNTGSSNKESALFNIIENFKIKDDGTILDGGGDGYRTESRMLQPDPDVNLFISSPSILTNSGEVVYNLIQFDTMSLNNYISAILNTLVPCNNNSNKKSESIANNASNSIDTNVNVDLEKHFRRRR
ncbi:hypothetical protein B5S27_g4939 [[Candida] boidinii]|nr:hypothetical protein B5S27_g4939 [[Candida] boidinii]